MQTTITMPQLGETVTEGTVAQWLKKPGESVEKYEAFVEVSTDKVNAEVPAPVSGTITELLVREGETVKIGTPIAVIEEVGAAASSGEAVAVAPPPSSRAEANRQASDEPVPGGSVGLATSAFAAAPSPNGQGGAVAPPLTGPGGTRVSPAVRRLAREHHVDLARVHGTGTSGRITANDVLAAAKTTPAPAVERPAPVQPGELIPLSHVRALIAQRMVESKHTAPHAWTMVEVDVTTLATWRTREKDAFERAHGVKLTLLPFFIRACVEALAQFPLMNASFTDEGIRVHRDVNVGIAIAADGTLLVPVIRNAEKLSIAGIALAAGALIEKARHGRLSADDLTGGTFTVNNTGANGSILSAPILVPGQTGIVTMEAAVKRPVVRDDDAIAIRTMMNVCLSLDHRVVDGAVASGFLVDLKRRLEAMGPSGSL